MLHFVLWWGGGVKVLKYMRKHCNKTMQIVYDEIFIERELGHFSQLAQAG